MIRLCSEARVTFDHARLLDLHNINSFRFIITGGQVLVFRVVLRSLGYIYPGSSARFIWPPLVLVV